MARKYSNTFAETTLTGSISNSATVILIGSTAGLPASFPYTLAIDYDTASVEMVTVTALAGSNLTVVRGQDGTSAQSHNAGARVVHPVTARDLAEPQAHIDAVTDIHGLSGGAAVVGTTSTQTLTGKTISGAANTITNIPDSAIVAVSAAKVLQPFAAVSVVGADGTAQALTVTGDEVTRTTPVASAKRSGIGLAVDHDSVVDVSSDLSVDAQRPNGSAALTSRVYIRATTKIGAIIQRVAAQVQDLFRIVTEGGANLFKVDSNGAVTAASSITAGTSVTAGTSLGGATLATTGNATIGGTLGVTGALTASAGVAVTGALTTTTSVTATTTVNGTTDVQVNGDTLPRGYVSHSTQTAAVLSTGTTEIVGPSVTFTAIAGRRYKLRYSGGFLCDVAATPGSESYEIRTRWQAGAVLTTGGTSGRVTQSGAPVANFVWPLERMDVVTGIAAGQTTIGLTIKRATGSGVGQIFADVARTGLLVVEDLGD